MTRVSAAVSTLGDTGEASREAARHVRGELGGADVDLAFCFLTPEHSGSVPAAVTGVCAELAPRQLLGCIAQGVVGGDRELEAGPAAAVWAASLPGAVVKPFHLRAEDLGEDADGLAALDGADLALLLVDPFTFPADVLLRRAADDHPGIPLVGGIAVGGNGPGLQSLLLNGEVHASGAVGVSLAGVPVEAVVSQGCAPLGRDAVITEADGNVVLQLAGQPALERLRDTVAGLSQREQALAARGLLAGLVIDENKPEYGRGDFLMRSIIGADESTGAIAVGDRVRVGQTLRFHARDAASAEEDLAATLDEALGRTSRSPAGALLFTCNGRGTAMFSTPDHDARAVANAVGRPAVGGLFCGGEIGPVGGRSFLHGFTATMAVFLDEERRSRPDAAGR